MEGVISPTPLGGEERYGVDLDRGSGGLERRTGKEGGGVLGAAGGGEETGEGARPGAQYFGKECLSILWAFLYTTFSAYVSDRSPYFLTWAIIVSFFIIIIIIIAAVVTTTITIITNNLLISFFLYFFICLYILCLYLYIYLYYRIFLEYFYQSILKTISIYLSIHLPNYVFLKYVLYYYIDYVYIHCTKS